MRNLSLVVAVATLLGATAPALAADTDGFKNDQEKNSYSVGYDIGKSVHIQLPDVDADSLARGLKDALTDAKPALTEDEMQRRSVAMRQESILKAAERNRKEGEEFLAKNKKAKGVKTTASGLQYKVIRAGKGKTPKAEDTVTVHYRGTLVNGQEFDSSYKRNQPATFPVKGVIPGWTEALQLMPEGSKWMLYLPASIAYGERGAGHLIAPNSTLIFEVELLSINPAKP